MSDNVEQNLSDSSSEYSQAKSHILRVSSLYKNFGKKKVVQGIDFFILLVSI